MNSIADRILDCFPSGSYALTGLLRLVDIVETHEVPTAAVECRVQPRLLINPLFVEKHAETPEKLLMLVMHELHHVLLGHTTLFPTSSPVQNFVFDCVINALISRMFPAAEHTAFLTDFYDEGCFPECLLRPPAEWNPDANVTVPRGIRELPPGEERNISEVYRGLYSVAGVTYKEIFDVLPRCLERVDIEEVPLLGDHEGDSTGGHLESRSPVLFEVAREAVEKWPQPPDPIRGRSLADVLQENTVEVRGNPGRRSILRTLLHKVADRAGQGSVRRVREGRTMACTPVPTLDRRTGVLHSLGVQTLLYAGEVAWPRRVPSGDKVHVYVDVSGSMAGLEGAIYGAILDCLDCVEQRVHLFSTKVQDISYTEIRNGIVQSTGGTDIDCVAKHLAQHRIRRACLITDGWVGKPAGSICRALKKVRLGVVYTGHNVNTQDLQDVVNHVVHLPL